MPDTISPIRHFLDLDLLEKQDLHAIINKAIELKNNKFNTLLKNKSLACIFEKPSTRTRVSFEVGMQQLGGHVFNMSPVDMQLGRGETIADTAKVLSRYVDMIMIRTTAEEKLHELAENASVPVINGLTDRTHPCQLMADIMTIIERFGTAKDKIITWSGDGNNMATSWIHAASQFDFCLRLACPNELMPPQDVLDWAKKQQANIEIYDDASKATNGADCVVTDTWVSMGDDAGESRHNLLRPFHVDEKLMALASPHAIFMHCLPAHRGEEVSSAVIDGEQSAVWDEAENRLHAQKAIMLWCQNII